jgi:hypothetical protein
MSEKRYVARSTKVAARMIGDEMMIMSGRDSTLFALNRTAALLWEAADGVTPLEDIVGRQICARFDVEPGAALRDAEEVVEQLAGHGLLLLSEAPLVDGVESRSAGEII